MKEDEFTFFVQTISVALVTQDNEYLLLFNVGYNCNYFITMIWATYLR